MLLMHVGQKGSRVSMPFLTAPKDLHVAQAFWAGRFSNS
jgi:hypothetical protein